MWHSICRRLTLLFSVLILTSCVYPVTMYSLDGEKLDGRWRYAREGTGLVQISGPAGEKLAGTFQPVPRQIFFEGYEKTFGGGTIDADGPDLSALGNPFGGLLGSSSTLMDVARGENYDAASGKAAHVAMGPLVFWTASLQGDKQTMRCFLIGSSYTGHGFGRCKAATGKEYTVEF